MLKKSTTHRVLVRITQGMRLLGRPRRRWEHNDKTDIQEIGYIMWVVKRSGLFRSHAALNRPVS
jgi:hypothetical protein